MASFRFRTMVVVVEILLGEDFCIINSTYTITATTFPFYALDESRRDLSMKTCYPAHHRTPS